LSAPKERMDQETTKQAGHYLFKATNRETDRDSDYLDMRTRVFSDESMKLLLYYGVMAENFGSSSAQKIKDRIERLLISKNGLGREEAVSVLKQNFPKRVEIEKGKEGEY